MAKRIKKGEPEMLIVSFCDIVTITTAAMFFAMLITVQEAVKIPILSPGITTFKTDKRAVFIECRKNQLFILDKAGLDDQVANLLNSLSPNVRSGDMTAFLKAIGGREVTNRYYRVEPKFLLAAILALEPQPEAKGESVEDAERPNGNFQHALKQLDPKKQYLAFLVRGDSFEVFRSARQVADKLEFDTGWEFLGKNEPIKFGAGGTTLDIQK